jgi:phosphatidylinositol glycan class F
MTTTTPISKPRPATAPIDILPTNAARAYTHIHPALVLSLYALRFNAIVADPVPALLWNLVPLSALQVAYVTVCLPPTTGSSTPVVVKGKRKGKNEGQSHASKVVVRDFTQFPAYIAQEHYLKLWGMDY